MAEGLAGCHEQSLFHGLLKPSNLMIGTDGQVRILDLGIGCLLSETEGESLVDTMSTANSVSSGLDCASPESIMDPTNLTPAGDQYSLGCVLYYCLSGRYPFPDGTAVEKMMAHQTKQPTPLRQLNPDLPADLVAVVERLMQRAPESRFASAQEVAEALRPLAASPAARPAVRPKAVSEPEAGTTAGPRIARYAPSRAPSGVDAGPACRSLGRTTQPSIAPAKASRRTCGDRQASKPPGSVR